MDSDIQKDILEKLLKYGDGILGGSDEERHVSSRGVSTKQAVQQKKEKVKKKKQKKKKATIAVGKEQANQASNSKHNSMKEFEEELRMFRESRTIDSEQGIVEAKEREDERKKKKRKAPEVIIFEDPTKRKRDRLKRPETEGGKIGEESDGLELDKARHEVWKLGVSGLDFQDREKQEAAKAVQLGAKPPRKEYLNYKEFMEAQQQKKREEQEQRDLNRQMGIKTTKRREEKLQIRNKGFWTDKTQKKGVYIDGQLGKYKRGVQVISKRDVAKMKSSRGKGNKR